MSSSLLSLIPLAFVCLLAYLVVRSVYRLCFSPLAKFPGPKLAAITSLYAFYFDVYLGGQYIWEVERLHKQYGRVIRIRPDVLHVNDPGFIEQLYGTAGKRRNKYKIAGAGLPSNQIMLGTIDHDMHRRRRSPLNPFFSKQSVRRIDPLLHQTVSKLLRNLSQAAKPGKTVRMNLLYSAMTSDIIHEYCFGDNSNNLDKEDLNEPYVSAAQEGSRTYHFATFNPWLIPTIKTIPVAVMVILMPSVRAFLRLSQRLEKKITAAKEDMKSDSKDTTVTTIFHGFLGNTDIPEIEKSNARLVDEAIIFLGAGTDTTANTLAAITYHLLSSAEILRKLKAELEVAIPDMNVLPKATQIESLPYLTAVIQEGIRLHPGASLRQERVAPDEDLVYENPETGKRYIINRGTPVGMTATLISRLEDIYPLPSEFKPERFLDNPRLDRYQLAFSRGSRRCIGINLAYAELYMAIASIFRTYDLYDGTGNQAYPTLELFQTGRKDVDTAEDHSVPYLPKESLGVRVKVRAGVE